MPNFSSLSIVRSEHLRKNRQGEAPPPPRPGKVNAGKCRQSWNGDERAGRENWQTDEYLFTRTVDSTFATVR